MSSSVAEARRSLMDRLFPEGIPTLWCPPITHYLPDGTVDSMRIQAHLAHLAPHVGGLLAAGSTGDGWELDDARYRIVVQQTLAAAGKHSYRVLLGVLRKQPEEVHRRIAEWTHALAGTAANEALISRLSSRHVSAFTVCGPVGVDLPPASVEAALTGLLQTGVPLSLYQLPQVTGYNIDTGTLNGLAARFPNFLLFKDTSGEDAVATSPAPLPGVFLVRGAEGEYLRWLGLAGGPYHGFLLSSANCFAAQLHELIEAARQHRTTRAEQLSLQVTSAMRDLFEVVKAVQGGNAFANANKVGDHFMAFGPHGAPSSPPRLSTGQALPADVLQAGRAVLSRHALLPARGYLES